MDPSIGWGQSGTTGSSRGGCKNNNWNGTRGNRRSEPVAPEYIPIIHTDHNPSVGPLISNNNHHNNHHNNHNNIRNGGSQENSVLRLNHDVNQHQMAIYQGAPWRRKSIYPPHVFGLHEEINDFYEFMKPIEEEEYMRNKVVEKIEDVVRRLWPEARLEIFGSFATKLYLPTSDIDLVILGKWDVSPLHTLKNELIKSQVADDDDIKVLDKASVPIVKVVDSENRVRVDISFNVTNGVKSALLIKEFISEYPSLKKLVFVLKQFLYQRKLNEVFTGGISSYSLILMVISFLQLHPRENAKLDQSNLGVLLIEFFELYGRNFNYIRVGISVTNGGSYVPKSQILKEMEPGYRPSILCIQDPLNPQNDIGKSSYGALNVKRAFENAFHTLTSEIGPSRHPLNPSQSLLGLILSVEHNVVKRREWIRNTYGPQIKNGDSRR